MYNKEVNKAETLPMYTNLENQTFEEWVANPPEEYREIFQEIENLHKEMDEGLARLKRTLNID